MNDPTGLKRFVGARRPAGRLPFTPRPARPVRAGEACEMCHEAVAADAHSHVVHLESRRLLCACRPCYLLFTADGAGGGGYRAVPDRYLVDPGAPGAGLTDADWERLQVPVAVAFFFHNSALGRVVAHYPSPAGATESLLDLAAWDAVTATSPLAAAMAPDVEAVVVRRPPPGSGQPAEVFLVPIDACYALVGRLRLRWTGFDGGAEARADLADFFAGLRARSRPVEAAAP